jgi:hypothetical protein
VAIKPGEKAPIGDSWGLVRPTERSLGETFTRFPDAGLGLLLGPKGGIIDIECDGPEGEESLAKLLGDEMLSTFGWSSARGPHHIFRHDPRLARYGKSIIKLPELPGLEIRIGGSGKQLQSNCPPTVGTDGKPREWNGTWVIADLPEAFFVFLDDALARPKREPVARATTPTAPSTRDSHAAKALDEECQSVALAIDGAQNDTLNKAAYNLGQLVGAGSLERSEVERRLLDAAAGYIAKDGERAARATIQSGLNTGQGQPRDLSHLDTNCNGRTERREGGTVTGPPPWPPLRVSKAPRPLPFPVEVFPPRLQAYCREVAKAKLAPLDFAGASMLAVAGAAIGQSVNIEVKRDWTEAPLVFVVIVAPPGKTKSPVTRAVAKPLTEIDRRLREESAKAHEAWVDRKKAHDKDDSAPLPGPEPRRRRAIVKDVTRESLATILADNPRGVLCDPDEASGWIASFNEYKAKGGSDREFWLSIWGSASISVDRKGGRESTYVAFPFAALVGGLPPVKLDKLTDERSQSDGLLDRILFTYPDVFPPQHWTEAELSEEAEKDWSNAIAKLFDTPMYIKDDRELPYLANFTPEAKQAWVDWFNAHADEMDGLEFSSRQSGAWSKMRAHAARFALILTRLFWACDPPAVIAPAQSPWETNIGGERCISHSIGVTHVEGAIKLATYYKSHLLCVAHQMTGGIGDAAAEVIVDWIKRKKLSTFREADVGVDLRKLRDQPKALEQGLAKLLDFGVIRRRQETHDPSRRGPKPTTAYDVHPDLQQAPGITSNSGNSDNSPIENPPEGNSGINGNSWRSQGNQQPPDR